MDAKEEQGDTYVGAQRYSNGYQRLRIDYVTADSPEAALALGQGLDSP